MVKALKNNFSIYLAIGMSFFIGFGIAFLAFDKGSSELVDEAKNSVSLMMKGEGVVYREECSSEIIKTRVCSVEITQKNASHAIARIHYHYVKGIEDSNRIFVSADQGKFDNKIGVSSIFSAAPGDNFIDVKFGLFSPDKFTDEAYVSDFLNVEIRGADDVKNIYLPSIVMLNIEYHKKWSAVK